MKDYFYNEFCEEAPSTPIWEDIYGSKHSYIPPLFQD